MADLNSDSILESYWTYIDSLIRGLHMAATPR